LCRPVIGLHLSYPQWSVHKVHAFGAHVVGNRSTRCFSRMSPVMQER
jgi:hypothetical protein